MPEYTEDDLLLIRLLRSQMGQEWSEAKKYILEQLPPHIDPEQLGKFVDESPSPGIHINAWGIEPRFYAHRDSRRLLEFYQIRSLKY